MSLFFLVSLISIYKSVLLFKMLVLNIERQDGSRVGLKDSEPL